MATYDTTLPQNPYTAVNAGVIPNAVFGVAINWFVNRTPLFARLPRLPVGSTQFLITYDNYRPRSAVLTAAFSDTSGTTLTVADSSVFVLGDVVEVDSEQMLVTAANASATTVTVSRGYAGSTAATHLNGATAYILTNTRTGAEVAVSAQERVPVTVTQNCQTIQHAYQVGGALQSATNYVSGMGSPLDRDRMLAMQNVVDDYESAMIYGKGVALAATTTRPAMKGFRTLVATNNTTSPTNAAAYKPSDLIRDTIQKCYDNGGNPNILVGSTDFLTAFSVWGHAAQRLDAGATVFGTPIDVFSVPFLGGLHFVPHPLLRPGTVLCFNTNEVRNRVKREIFEKPRGSRGDAVEGDIITEGAIEVDNENHQAFVSGITAYAAA